MYSGDIGNYQIIADGGVGNPSVYSGAGIPQFVASQGSVYISSNGSVYVSVTGSTTWTQMSVGGGGSGTVSAVTASSPLSSTGGASPNISITGIIPIGLGGTGSATPGIGAGTNIATSGAWPNQTVSVIANPSLTSLTITNPLAIASGGSGTASPGIVAGTNITVTGSWPTQTINSSAGSGLVTGVTATAPLASTGGTAPVISINQSPTFTGVVTGTSVTSTAASAVGTSMTVGTFLNVGGPITPGLSGTVGTAAIYSGTGAPSFTAVKGSIFLSTNGSTYANSTGSTTWIVLAAGSGAVNTVTATAPIASTGGANPVVSISNAPTFSTSVNSPLFESLNGRGVLGVYNVVDFGAKVDSTTNDSTSITAAITAAFAAGGGVVYVPRGVSASCALGSQVNLKRTVSFYAPNIQFIPASGYTGNAFAFDSDTYNVFGETYTIGSIYNFVGVAILCTCTSANLNDVNLWCSNIVSCGVGVNVSVTNNSYGISALRLQIESFITNTDTILLSNDSTNPNNNGFQFGIQGCRFSGMQMIANANAIRYNGTYISTSGSLTVPTSGATVVATNAGGGNDRFASGDYVSVVDSVGKGFFGIVTSVAGATVTIKNQAVPTNGIFPQLGGAQYFGAATNGTVLSSPVVHCLHFQTGSNVFSYAVINGNSSSTYGIVFTGGWFNIASLFECEGSFASFNSSGAITANNRAAVFSGEFRLAVVSSGFSGYGAFSALAAPIYLNGLYSGNNIEVVGTNALAGNSPAQPAAVTTVGSTGRGSFNGGTAIMAISYIFSVTVASMSAGNTLTVYVYTPFATGYPPRVSAVNLSVQPIIIDVVVDQSTPLSGSSPIYGQIGIVLLAVGAVSASTLFYKIDFGKP